MKPTLHLDFFRWQGRIQGVSFHYLHYFHHSLASCQKNRGRTQPCPKTENWIKDLQNMAPPSRKRPSFPLSQSLSSGSFHKPLILLHQKEDRLKTTITENQTNRSNGPQPCQWNYDPCHVGPPKIDGHGGEFWQNMVLWRREWQTTSIFLPWESHEEHEKAKRQDTERWTPQVDRCPICYVKSVEK